MNFSLPAKQGFIHLSELFSVPIVCLLTLLPSEARPGFLVSCDERVLPLMNGVAHVFEKLLPLFICVVRVEQHSFISYA